MPVLHPRSSFSRAHVPADCQLRVKGRKQCMHVDLVDGEAGSNACMTLSPRSKMSLHSKFQERVNLSCPSEHLEEKSQTRLWPHGSRMVEVDKLICAWKSHDYKTRRQLGKVSSCAMALVTTRLSGLGFAGQDTQAGRMHTYNSTRRPEPENARCFVTV